MSENEIFHFHFRENEIFHFHFRVNENFHFHFCENEIFHFHLSENENESEKKMSDMRSHRRCRRAVAFAVADISSTIVAARALEGAAFVATRVAGEEGGGRDNQH